MDEFHSILQELDSMEAESRDRDRVRERERRRRAVKERKRKVRRRRLNLCLGIACGLLALPVFSMTYARLHAAPDSLLPRIGAPERVLVGDQSTYIPDNADTLAAVDDFTAYGDLSQTVAYVAENPENLLPGQKPEPSAPAKNPDAPATDSYFFENPENLLPGEDSMILTNPRAASTSDNAKTFTPARYSRTITLGQSAQIGSQYAVLLDADSGIIRAERNSDVKVPPASMTKVLTLLVAVEKLIKVTPEGVKGMDAKVTITRPVTNYCYANNCSVAGFSTWETVTVRDLLYACILPSGADACLALARHISGSHEDFVKLMNQKLQQLGISKTAHFTNCIGLYNKDHYCTMRDMAVIMKAAMDHSICRVILNARTFRTSATAEHPKGIALSNLFLRRIEDRFAGTNLVIKGAKTGYVNQSGNCAVSYASRSDGRNYICVTGKAAGAWQAIYDHTTLYKSYCLS